MSVAFRYNRDNEVLHKANVIIESESENKTMIISELKIYNFRRFKSVDGAPGLKINFHKGLNALIGENDSGKTAVIIMVS